MGLSLPGDLAVLLGSQAVVTVADQDFSALGDSMPKVGLRSTTDAARAQTVVQKVLDTIAQQQGTTASALPVRTRADGRTFTLALDDGYLQTLASGQGLGKADGFTKALADTRPSTGLYVDLDRLEGQYLDQVPEDRRESVKAMRGIGMETTQDGPGRADFSLRLVAN